MWQNMSVGWAVMWGWLAQVHGGGVGEHVEGAGLIQALAHLGGVRVPEDLGQDLGESHGAMAR